MGKTPNFEDWKWPWKQGEVDEEKAAKMIHRLKVGFEDQQDLVQERDERIAALTDELESAKAAKSGTDAEAQEELKELRKENRTLKNAEAKSLPADEKRLWQYEAALELGLTASQARRLQGDSLDEIKADAKDFAKDLGISDEDDDGDGDNNGSGPAGPPPQQQPAARFSTGSPGADRVKVVSNPTEAANSLPPLFG